MDRRDFLKFLGAGAVLGLSGGAAGYTYVRHIAPYDLELTETAIPIWGLAPELAGLRIALLSDLHVEDVRFSYLESVVETHNRLEPDLTLIPGDFVSSQAAATPDLAHLLTELRTPLGVYGSLGNHDLWAGAGAVRRALETTGLPILVDEGLTLTVGNAQLYLAGAMTAWDAPADLNRALAGAPAGPPIVLMAHEPDTVLNAVQAGPVSLQVSGHSHGGQVRLPGLGAPILPPLGRRYPAGRYQVGDTWLYTSRGIGMSGIPFRFNCRPELAILRLEAA